jgi:WD40-like Beta Propeller Repeat
VKRAAVAVVVAGALAALTTGLAGRASGTTAAAGPQILFGSDCGGSYATRPDGSRLTPLAPRERSLNVIAVSADRSTVAYYDRRNSSRQTIWVSRANGTRLRRVARYYGGPVALTRDGRRLAFTIDGKSNKANGIWVVGTDGRGLRRLTAGRQDGDVDWAPSGATLAFTRGTRTSTVVVQPLRGKPRVLARGGESPRWSPNGRSIAYLRTAKAGSELWIVRPDGSRRHRLASKTGRFAWSPTGNALAFGAYWGLGVVGADGRGLRRLVRGTADEPRWSPDGRRIAFKASRDDGFFPQIWVVGRDGWGLRQVTKDCQNWLVGWSRSAPVLAPDPAPERVLEENVVATRDPITDLSADGSDVAFLVQPSPAECEHVAVWRRAMKSMTGFRASPPCRRGGYGFLYDVELAGTRATWVSTACGNSCEAFLESGTFADTRARDVSSGGSFDLDGEEMYDYHAHGDGDLLVYNEGTSLVRLGSGAQKCEQSQCTTLRKDAHAAPVDSVSAGHIAVRERDEVAVLDGAGTLLRLFPFAPEEVAVARLDEGRLVVARLAVVEVYDVATGIRVRSVPLPAGFKLFDVDSGIAMLQGGKTIMLLRLDDGHSFTLTPERGPVLGDLEPPGLYYSYVVGQEGRIVVMPRSELLRRLG